MKLIFDTFEVNTSDFELRHKGERKNVEPKVFDLIAFLATNPGKVFTREELIDSVWNGRIVSDATVATCVKNARKALGDTGDNQQYVQTVRGRGYRFSGDVEKDQGPPPVSTAPTLPDADPSIMILPLHCTSDNIEMHRLSTEITDNIGRIISRVPLLRFSSEANHYKNDPTPPTARTVHEDFGVDLVLDGTVQENGTRACAVIQLSNARTGFRIWSESFDVEQPFYSHLDEVVAMAIGRLEPQIHKAMYSMVRSRNDSPNARRLFLEANGLLVMRGWSHDSFDTANEILTSSAKLDPEFALTHALQALLYGFGSRIGLSVEREKAHAEARRAAETALELDNMDSTVVGLAGCSLADIGDTNRGESLLRNAIDLNPANAQAWVALGAVRLSQFDAPEAISLLSKGIDNSPHDSRLSVWGSFLAVARLFNQQIDQACVDAELACRRHDQTYLPRVALAAASLVQGNEPAAKNALADARRIKPDLSFSQVAALVGPDLAKNLMNIDGS